MKTAAVNGLGLRRHGAGGGDRTRTVFPPGDFKSPASASSATPTIYLYFTTFHPVCQTRGDCFFSPDPV